jgi:hypothetical protein
MPQQSGEEIEDQRLHRELATGQAKAASFLAQLEIAEAIGSHRQRPFLHPIGVRS